MSQAYVALPYRSDQRRRLFTTLSLICDDESLSDAQIKAYQTRLQEYRTFLEAVSRLALCSNVCVTEEAVTIGEHGLLTGESLNALQHAGAISVYNTLQQNNWEFPMSEEGEVAIVKAHVPIPDEFLDSEKPIRSDWPAVHISECFVEGERAKLHGSVRPLRTFLPPTIVFRNAADVDEDVPEPEVNIINSGPEGSIEIVQSFKGLSVKKPCKDGKGVRYIPIDEYYFGRQDGNADYAEEKGDFRFKCAVCQRIFYSNTKLMSHILGHVDDTSRACLDSADTTQCSVCNQIFPCAFDLRDHIEKEHTVSSSGPNLTSDEARAGSITQITPQFLIQERIGDSHDDLISNVDHMDILAPNLNGVSNTPSCRICGKVAASNLLLAHHLQSTHRQREMPYVCRLCLFRSSMYEDILDHFKKVHDNSNHLLCTYCLRIFTPSDARPNVQSVCLSASGGMSTVGLGVGQTQVYLQHLRMHQIKHQLRRCPTCRLNFTNKSDYQVHRRLDHKATRDVGTEQPGRQDSYESESYHTKKHIGNADQATEHSVDYNQSVDSFCINRPQVTSMNAPEAGCAKNLAIHLFPENIENLDCLECGKCMGDSEHAQYLPCSVCRFATCCRVGFQRHFQKAHLYSNASQSTDLDTGMPMVRQVFFDWCNNEDNVDCQNNIDESESSTFLNSQNNLIMNEFTDLTPINPNYSIVKYMESQIDSRHLCCSHCGASNLDGNSLARHLVEECGTLTATLNPDPLLLYSQTTTEQTQETEKHKQSHLNQNSNNIPFGSTDQKVVMISESSLSPTTVTSVPDSDVIMMNVDNDQLPSVQLDNESIEDQTNILNCSQITTQTSTNGTTTIDVTDAGGEVVQQFILPDDLQLEEGQTLVMIQGENGQPQLAIVNQADLINANNSDEVLVQTEDDEVDNMLIYSNSLENQPDDTELSREDEKENQQFIV
ncbi:Pogo transposable element with ZNF domain [Schistosoma japonicum]|uniref:Pogo transposable element with ZNF domain n=1 Tax=Schistosoma japonicum TaxID=6182 RepID=A0A4Z2DHL6_SCHJA|nr:Pogo transposable element with ZNF domain [Schistosoma japonicum]TNN15977.1 Pogo transposable element with ZNF domain [Schistosoma japonicum]